MRCRYIWYATAALSILAITPAGAYAQEIGSTGSRVQESDPEYRLELINVGPFTLDAGSEVRLEYSSNVFAEPLGAEDDAVLTFRPYAELEHRSGAVATTLNARADIRRFADISSENSEGASVSLASSWSPHPGEALSVRGSWDRVAEDRGDPEARRVQGLGPRIFNVLGGSVGYHRRGSRFLFGMSAEVREIDAVAAIDDLRDHDNFSGRFTAGFKPGGSFYFTGTGYYTRLDFRLDDPITGADRDVSTVGALVGVQFADGGLIEGSLGAGIFKLNAEDPSSEDRTGFSMEGQLTYRPRRRTSIQLNLFNGNVASFRGGGSTRIDTRIGLSVQQEVRHNLFASVEAGWERTNFYSVDTSLQTFRGSASMEYLFSRHFSVIATLGLDHRTSDIPLEEFDRVRGGIGVRLRF